jgi:hypothetical protein
MPKPLLSGYMLENKKLSSVVGCTDTRDRYKETLTFKLAISLGSIFVAMCARSKGDALRFMNSKEYSLDGQVGDLQYSTSGSLMPACLPGQQWRYSC